MRLKTKITFSIIGSLFVLITISAIVFGTISNAEYQEKAKENIKQRTRELANNLDLKLQFYSKLVNDFASKTVNLGYLPDVFREEKRLNSEFSKFINTTKSGIATTVFAPIKEIEIDKSKDKAEQSKLNYTFNHPLLRTDFSKYEWWQEVKDTKKPITTNVTSDLGDEEIIFAKPIFSYFRENDEPVFLGIIVVTLPITFLQTEFKNERIGDTGELLIIDGFSEKVLFQSNISQNFPANLNNWKIDNISKITDGLKISNELKRNRGNTTIIFNNKKYFLSFYPILSSHWSLAVIQEYKELNQGQGQTIIVVIATFLIGILFALIVTERLISRMTKPLNDNLKILRQMAEGKNNYEGILNVDSHDEIGEISGYFMQVIDNLKNVSKNLNIDLEKEKKEKTETIHALHDTEKRFKAIFNQTLQYIWLLKPNGTIVEANSAISDFTGLKQSEIQEINFQDAEWWRKPKKSHNLITEQLKIAENGKIAHFEIDFVGNGISCILDFSLKPVLMADRKAQLILAEGRDITARKLMEQELQKHRDKLEILVRDRTTELEKAQQELLIKEKFSVLGQLTAIVSHELRNPLGTIRSSSYVVKHGLKPVDARMIRALERIERNVIRCDSIIEELLDYTRETKIQLKPEHFTAWLKNFLQAYECPPTIILSLELNNEALVMMDTEHFRRVVVNIMDNAVQCFEQMEELNKKIITIKTEIIGEKLLFSVADNGPGIAPEDMNHLFEPLFSTKSFGIGLGLAIVKDITVQHNSEITIDTDQTKGTCFTIHLPISTKTEAAQHGSD